VKVRVEIYETMDKLDHYEAFRSYVIDYDNPQERATFAKQCHNAFEANQFVLTYPVTADTSNKSPDACN
jgi:hypothetical protein